VSAHAYPRRGIHWELFNRGSDDGPLEVQVIDTPDDEGEESWPWEQGDWDAAAFVLTTTSDPNDDCPAEVVEECRQAVRELVASWSDTDKQRREHANAMQDFLERQNERAIEDSKNGGTPSGD
jgi:hypothetical protein